MAKSSDRSPARRAAAVALEGVEPVGNSPAEFGAYIKSELAKYATLARRANIRAD
jgi:tripartite-type tricarboxylate transporter receptor subunit TctC